jgi:hypothetical protein
MTGTGGGYFSPQGGFTFEQALVVLVRMFEQVMEMPNPYNHGEFSIVQANWGAGLGFYIADALSKERLGQIRWSTCSPNIATISLNPSNNWATVNFSRLPIGTEETIAITASDGHHSAIGTLDFQIGNMNALTWTFLGHEYSEEDLFYEPPTEEAEPTRPTLTPPLGSAYPRPATTTGQLSADITWPIARVEHDGFLLFIEQNVFVDNADLLATIPLSDFFDHLINVGRSQVGATITGQRRSMGRIDYLMTSGLDAAGVPYVRTYTHALHGQNWLFRRLDILFTAEELINALGLQTHQ